MLKRAVFALMVCIEMVWCKLLPEQVSAITTVFDIINNDPKADRSFTWNYNATKFSNYPCLWDGVFCNPDNSFIITITFSSRSIFTSEFLPFICNITTLESLDVSQNHLTSIPDGFFTGCGNMSGLKHLDFSWNKLNGSLPGFNGFKMLQHLDVSHNFLSGGISLQLDGLVSLKFLNLSYNKFMGRIPANLGKLNHLVDLKLHVNFFTGSIPGELGELTRLQSLWLYYNFLSGSIPPCLSNITTLQVLWADSNSLNGSIPSGIAWHLKALSLSNNMVGGRIPCDLLSAPYLEFLDLSYNELEGPLPVINGTFPWETHESLKVLFLQNNRLTGILPLYISRMQNLSVLSLEGNNLHGPIPDSIGNLSSLKLLYLGNNQLSGRIPVTLSQLHGLFQLGLQSNKLSGPIPDFIGNMSYLRNLLLGNNRLSGTIPESLSCLWYLETLDLQGNNLHGPIPHSNRNFTYLRELKLGNNQLSGTIIDLPTFLEYLDLQGNNLHGPIPINIRNLSFLYQLQLGSNRLSGSIPHMPKYLQHILNLSFNLFSGPIPHTLSKLWYLEGLDLSNNRFSGEIPDFLTRLSRLTLLLLMNNNLSGVVPRFLNYVRVDTQGNEYLIDPTQNPGPGPPIPHRHKKSIHSDFLIAASGGMPIGLLISVIAVFIARRYNSIHGTLSNPNTIHGSIINFKKAMAAVSDPSNIILKARFSTFYKVVMPSGTTYLVKKFKHTNKIFQYPRYKELVEELEIIGELSNTNVMVPVAYILTMHRAYLFYEFVRGTLYDILHHRMGCRLDWASRFNIAIGVSKGLAFLHECSSGPIILFDLCSKSILLKFIDEPQISDIELCNLIHPSNIVFAGSVGYTPPEFAKTKRMTAAGNVYSFGVVLLELVTGKPALSEGTELAKWVLSISEQQSRWDEILDLSVSETSVAARNQMVAVVEVALACICISPETRPNSVTVVQMLKSIGS